MLDPFRIHRGLSPRLALTVIALALLARVLVPQGWMPAETAGGWRITLCTGSGPMPMDMAVPMMTSATKAMRPGPGDHDHAPGDHPCAFASVALALDEPVLPVLDLPRPMQAIWAAWAGFVVAVGRGLAAPPPPATGPPLA